MEKIAMVWERKRLQMVRRAVENYLDRLRYEGKRQHGRRG